MAEDKQQLDRQEQTPPRTSAPSEGEVFAAPPIRKPRQGDVFTSLVEFASEPDRSEVDGFLEIAAQEKDGLGGLGCLSYMQKVLLIGIVAVAATLTFVLVGRMTPTRSPSTGTEVRSPSREQTSPPPDRQMSSPAMDHRAGAYDLQRPAVSPDEVATTQPDLVDGSPTRGTALGGPETQPEGSSWGTRPLPSPAPLSLQLADKLYLRRDFEQAMTMYDKLSRRLPATEDNQPLRDFLVLRLALCGKNSGHVAQADSLFRTASLSRLPILRALARYHQGTTLLGRERYLEATARAYQTLALIEVVDYDKKWVSAVQRQCHFLVAEAMTRNLLALCDADANLPAALWTEQPDVDPFVGMEESQLRIFLASGADQLEGTVLGPQIRKVGPEATARWSVLCSGASIEELLARFATNAGLNVRWADSGQAGGTEDNVRARPVYLYLTSAPPQQVAILAAGSVGLLAQVDEKSDIRVLDPTTYSSLAHHTKLLADESISLWQRFLLTAENDPRTTNAHFALGLVQAARGQFEEALAEYKLVANRAAKHALASHALLQSGILRVRLRDYVGAHADLKQLVELYPETETSDRACLYLADATMKAGLYAEATGLYRKVYNLGLSVASQAESALGAGRCFYETQDYEEAAQWLNRYVATAQDRSRPEFYTACLLLGKTCLALHQPQQAHAALNLALRGELSHQQHVETVAVLVRAYIEEGLFLEALQALAVTTGWQLSQQETVELLLLRAHVFRAIGLAEKAIALLEEKSQYLPSPELQARVALELGRSYAEAGRLESARKTLGQAFATVEPGPLAGQIGCELAGTCLRLGQTAQAIAVCSQLLERVSTAAERQPILSLLAQAYRQQGRYEQAVHILLDQDESAGDPNAAPVVKDNRS